MRRGIWAVGVVMVSAALSVGNAHADVTASLNGTLTLNALTGGVGSTQGTHCCVQSGFLVVIGSPRRGNTDGAVGLRQARDQAFGASIGGPAIDRSFRFRANSVQRSGF